MAASWTWGRMPNVRRPNTLDVELLLLRHDPPLYSRVPRATDTGRPISIRQEHRKHQQTPDPPTATFLATYIASGPSTPLSTPPTLFRVSFINYIKQQTGNVPSTATQDLFPFLFFPGIFFHGGSPFVRLFAHSTFLLRRMRSSHESSKQSIKPPNQPIYQSINQSIASWGEANHGNNHSIHSSINQSIPSIN